MRVSDLNSLMTQSSVSPEIDKKLNADATGKAAEADKVAREFETLFMDLVMKSMRQTAKPEEQSNATEIFQGMLDGEYSKNMTGAHDFGIRSLILNWMKNVDPELGKSAAAKYSVENKLR